MLQVSKAPPHSPTSRELTFPPRPKTQCSAVCIRKEQFQSDFNCFVPCQSVWPQDPSYTTHDLSPANCCLNGLTVQASGLLDPASSTSFISEHMAQCLSLHRSRQFAQIVGVGGISHQSISQLVVNFCVTPVWSSGRKLKVEAVVLPKVTNNLPLHPISPQPNWQHLSDL